MNVAVNAGTYKRINEMKGISCSCSSFAFAFALVVAVRSCKNEMPWEAMTYQWDYRLTGKCQIFL